jgi:hypothetical protein
MSAGSIDFSAIVWERDDITPVKGVIPLTLSGKDIMNFLTLTMKMKIPANYFLIVCLPTPDGGKIYRILDEGKDLRRYSALKLLEFYLYPPNLLIDIQCPGGARTVKRQFDSKRPAGELVEELCDVPHMDEATGKRRGFFSLKGPIAYCLYPNPKNMREPIPSNKSIVESDLKVKSLWLQRRFWIAAINHFTQESDIHFNYCQAKEMVWAPDFEFKNYNTNILLTIAFCVEYEDQDRAKKLVKDTKNKKKELVKYFPEWFCGDSSKDKKARTKVVDTMANYKGKDKNTLKLWFLRECLKNKYFGSLDFPVHCVIPGSKIKEQQDVLFTVTEEAIYLNDMKTKAELFGCKNSQIRKWKPANPELVIFHYLDERREVKQLDIYHYNVLLIIDHFTALVNFLKQQKLLSQTDELGDRTIHSFHTTSGTSASTMSVLMRNDSTLKPIGFAGIADGDYPSTLPRVEPPMPQRIEHLDADALQVDTEFQNYADEFGKYYDPNETGYEFCDFPMYNLRDDIIEPSCMLLRNAISTGIPTTTLSQFCDSSMSNSPFMNQIVTRLLDAQWDPSIESAPSFRVGLVAQALEQTTTSELPPLDAFASLNYIRSALLDYGQKQWKDFDFIGNAEKIDPNLGNIVRSSLGVMGRANHPLSTVLFQAMAGTSPDAKALLMLNDSIADGLMMIAQKVAQSLCDANIHEFELQPLLASFPPVVTFDPILGTRLADTLLPIMREVSKDDDLKARLLAQPHVAKVEVASMLKAIQDLAGFTHFLNSPLAMFIQTKAGKMSDDILTPSSVPEAMDAYQTAREMALLLWNMDEAENAALAQEIADGAANYYSLFLASQDDPSLNPLAANMFRGLQAAVHSGLELIAAKTELTSLLNPNNALQNMTLQLLGGVQDWQTSASLLTLEAMDEQQRRDLICAYGNQIDARLRAINGPVGEKEKIAFSNLFKMFSMGVLSVAPPELGVDIRKKSAELGALLMSVLGDSMLSEEQRREKCANIRNAIRPLLALHEDLDPFDVLRGFLANLLDTQLPKTYEITFSIKAPDLSMQLSMLKKLTGVLKEFDLAVGA